MTAELEKSIDISHFFDASRIPCVISKITGSRARDCLDGAQPAQDRSDVRRHWLAKVFGRLRDGIDLNGFGGRDLGGDAFRFRSAAVPAGSNEHRATCGLEPERKARGGGERALFKVADGRGRGKAVEGEPEEGDDLPREGGRRRRCRLEERFRGTAGRDGHHDDDGGQQDLQGL